MRSAEDARIAANNFKQSSLAKAIEEIEKEIDKAVLKGETKCTVFRFLSPEVIIELRSHGYQVTKGQACNDQRGELTYTISWA